MSRPNGGGDEAEVESKVCRSTGLTAGGATAQV